MIASRKSKFKNAVVQKIDEAFRDQDVYIKIIGIGQLKNEDANHYCKYGDMDTIIVLTTSGGGDVLPKTKNRKIDAISSASTKEEIKPVSNRIIRKINMIIYNKDEMRS